MIEISLAGLKKKQIQFLSTERSLILSILSAIFFLFYGHQLLLSQLNEFYVLLIFIWLFSIILWGMFAVVRHAEALVILLGEPYGTLILTLSVTLVEVMIIASIMLFGANDPTFARNTMFAVIMIELNGIMGVCLLLGGLRYSEQIYNLEGSKAFLSVIILLTTVALIIPNFTHSTSGPTFSLYQAVFLILSSIFIYIVFLGIQTISHRSYFIPPSFPNLFEYSKKIVRCKPDTRNCLHHSLLLLAYLTPSIFLAKQIAIPIDHTITTLKAPPAIGGIIVAILILTPESLSAIHASIRNLLQRSVNVLLGSVLATIGLTVPMILIIGICTGKTIILGLDNKDMILLFITLITSIVTFGSGRTNVLQGSVHLLLFFTYIILIFD